MELQEKITRLQIIMEQLERMTDSTTNEDARIDEITKQIWQYLEELEILKDNDKVDQSKEVARNVLTTND